VIIKIILSLRASRLTSDGEQMWVEVERIDEKE